MAEQFKLGKKEYKYDDRTVRMATFLAIPPEIHIPNTFDFDKGRKELPIQMWGNDAWGDCVEVGIHHQAARHHRLETHHSLKITPEIVVSAYQDESERQFGHRPVSPGDQYDNGLYILNTIRNWRSLGLKIPYKSTKHTFKIDVFGELDKGDHEQLRAGCFLLTGVIFGLWLPKTAKRQIQDGKPWDDTGEPDTGDARPGSWGGHCVYAKKYDAQGFRCITWGREQYMTNAFIERYCDEAWVTVDSIENHSRYVDGKKLNKYLHDIGATVNP